MTPDRMLSPGVGDVYKGGVHLTLFALAAVCTAYNVGAFLSRPTRKLAINTAVYGGLMALEARQVHAHFSSAGATQAREGQR